MYLPSPNEERRPELLHALMRRYPLATWAVQGVQGIEVNHLPFLLKPERGPLGTLVGHVARANPVWRSGEVSGVACFSGPQAYISPGWYPSKALHGMAVPTWNYAVVHAHGRARFIEDRAWLLAHVSELSAHFEASQPAPWKVSDAPADFIDRLLGAIVGVEIDIERFEGKWKTSQNRSREDKLAVIEHLRHSADAQASAMAEVIQTHADPL